MVKAGERYKNYIELCRAMGEEPEAGNSKKSQLKRWGLRMLWHKEGNAYVIDKVYKKPLEKIDGRTSNNTVHVDLFMPYVIECFLKVRLRSGWIGTQRLMRDVLFLVPGWMYEQLNDEATSKEKFCEMYGIKSYDHFIDFLHSYETAVKETIRGCLNQLQREECLEWGIGHMFKVEGMQTRFACTDKYEEIIKLFEDKVCENINKKYGYKVSGKRLLMHIRHRPGDIKEYYKQVMSLLLTEPELVRLLSEDYKKRYDKELNSDMISGYYKGYNVRRVDLKKIAGKAPPGTEYPTLRDPCYKRKIQEDIFERIKKRVPIPECDFQKIKTLFITEID